MLMYNLKQQKNIVGTARSSRHPNCCQKIKPFYRKSPLICWIFNVIVVKQWAEKNMNICQTYSIFDLRQS